MIPSTEIVNQLVDLLRFYDEVLTDELSSLNNLTKYREHYDPSNIRKFSLIYVKRNVEKRCFEEICS